MGGFVLKAPDFEAFPATAKQMLWLAKKNYIDLPDIMAEEIDAKSKADSFAKTVTIIQTTWFMIQCFGRAAQHLEFTTIELATVAFVSCTLPTCQHWTGKPVDVLTPTVIRTRGFTLADIISNEDNDPKRPVNPYKRTPLDFMDTCGGPSWSLTIIPAIKIPCGPYERPIRGLSNGRLHNVKKWRQFTLFMITMVYSSIHTIGWKFTFATAIEKYLWRASGLTHLLATFFFWVIDWHNSWLSRNRYAYTMHILLQVWKNSGEKSNSNETEMTGVPQAVDNGSNAIPQVGPGYTHYKKLLGATPSQALVKSLKSRVT